MQTRNGFSLLEMLICVSLILIFASFAVPRFSSATKTAQEAKVQADIRTISNAAALYEIDHGVFPASVDDLVTQAATANSICNSNRSRRTRGNTR